MPQPDWIIVADHVHPFMTTVVPFPDAAFSAMMLCRVTKVSSSQAASLNRTMNMNAVQDVGDVEECEELNTRNGVEVIYQSIN